MTRWYFLLLLGGVSLFALNEEQERELEQIDQRVESLEERKNRYLTSAMWNTREADRLMIWKRFTLDARWMQKHAEREQQRADYAQEEIDLLKKRRERILRESK